MGYGRPLRSGQFVAEGEPLAVEGDPLARGAGDSSEGSDRSTVQASTLDAMIATATAWTQRTEPDTMPKLGDRRPGRRQIRLFYVNRGRCDRVEPTVAAGDRRTTRIRFGPYGKGVHTMVVMVATAVAEWTAGGRPFTQADLAGMPDDGHRYELIDGVLIVSPAPSLWHQRVSTNLVGLLLPLCPPHLELLHAPFDVHLAEDTLVQPDLLVAPREQFTAQDLRGAPTLAVEILSPSTRRLDLTLKRDRYAAAGCAHYWVVDPYEVFAIAWRLVHGAYVEVGRADHDESLSLTEPFSLTLVPARLLQ